MFRFVFFIRMDYFTPSFPSKEKNREKFYSIMSLMVFRAYLTEKFEENLKMENFIRWVILFL